VVKKLDYPLELLALCEVESWRVEIFLLYVIWGCENRNFWNIWKEITNKGGNTFYLGMFDFCVVCAWLVIVLMTEI
jgi:hypothetical protein